jgi:hypothetical protein
VNFSVWLKGLGAAVIGGAVTGVAGTQIGPGLTAAQVKWAAIAGAVATALAYFKQSPVGGGGKGE